MISSPILPFLTMIPSTILPFLTITVPVTAVFDADSQRVDVSGAHEFDPPGPEDQRGPCPGLNALANHHYLPHNGVATIPQFIKACQTLGMGIDIITFLAIYAAIFDGNLISWSIGGQTPLVSLIGFHQPQGLSESHNKYESDASPTRGDLYLCGEVDTLQMKYFNMLYERQTGPDANYDLQVINAHRARRLAQSINENPYFFSGPFPHVIGTAGGYFFINRLLGNWSAERPDGVVTRETLKSFYGITGEDGQLVYTRGYERIPENWYRRPIEYTIPDYLKDLLEAFLQYPQFGSIGGNTGTVNSYAGIDFANLTGGVYNLQNLREGNNLACFAFQAFFMQAPDFLYDYPVLFASLTDYFVELVSGVTAGLGCPQLTKFDMSLFDKYPGWTKLKQDGTYD